MPNLNAPKQKCNITVNFTFVTDADHDLALETQFIAENYKNIRNIAVNSYVIASPIQYLPPGNGAVGQYNEQYIQLFNGE